MSSPWFLLADIGGTNARFAIGDPANNAICEQHRFAVDEHPTFYSALNHYMELVAQSGRWDALPVDACLAVACPTNGQILAFVNNPWRIDREELASVLQLQQPLLTNDFEALGHAIARFSDADWIQCGDGAADALAPIVVLGPGTGLGVCTVVRNSDTFHVLAGEGGHADYAPVDEEEVEIFRRIAKRDGRVSIERVLSGPGLRNIYWALSTEYGNGNTSLTPAQISAAALIGNDEIAVKAMHVFCRVLGSVAGNLALTLGARGGVYVAGGIVPETLELVLRSEFRARFLAKDPYHDYLNQIPTRFVTRPDPGLFGAFQQLLRRH